MEERVEVVGWHAAPVAAHREQVWATWLHGAVGAVRDGDRLLLVVPMGEVPATAVALALRLHHLGAWRALDGSRVSGSPAA